MVACDEPKEVGLPLTHTPQSRNHRQLLLPLGPVDGATQFDGQYQVLLRIEAEPSIYGGESGTAAFAMPSLRYFVGSLASAKPAWWPSPGTWSTAASGGAPR